MLQKRNPVLKAEEIRRQIEVLYNECPELRDDNVLQIDMLEGETDLFGFLTWVVDQILQENGMQNAIDDRIIQLDDRKKRYKRREDFCRKLAQRLLEAADLRKAVLAEATLHIQPGQPAVVITDPDQLPEDAWRIRRDPNLSHIKERLKAGEPVPGATLSNRQDTLYVRRR